MGVNLKERAIIREKGLMQPDRIRLPEQPTQKGCKTQPWMLGMRCVMCVPLLHTRIPEKSIAGMESDKVRCHGSDARHEECLKTKADSRERPAFFSVQLTEQL